MGMKVLIIYATRGGVSRRCAEMLYEKLADSTEVTLCNINDGAPAPDGFDTVILGGSIRMSRLNKQLKAYIRTHAETLNQKHCAVFLCCGFAESFDDYVHLQVPKTLIPSLGIHYFGGELKPDKLKGMDKLIVKAVRSSIVEADFESPDPEASPLPEIIPENIWRLADRIRALM